jgi:hypothetical protein
MLKQLKMVKIGVTIALLLVCSSTVQAENAQKEPSLAKPNLATQKYYHFYDDGGEHQADNCAAVNKLPKKLSKKLLKTKLATYLGSEQTEFSEQNEASIDAYEHYFSKAVDCKAALKQLQKEQEQFQKDHAN